MVNTNLTSESKRRKISNYGGDKVNYEDDVSCKLYFTDCRRRQADLYSAHLFKSAASRMLLLPATQGELLVSTGQSRMHLQLRKQLAVNETDIISPLKTRRQSSLGKTKSTGDINDFLLFSAGEKITFPTFPVTLEGEADIFRSHGYPLLVWPSYLTTKMVVKEYLSEHYPDCALRFNELDKVTTWLDQKWLPLAKAIGLLDEKKDTGVNTDVIPNSKESKHDNARVWIMDLPKDSVAATYCRQRLTFYQEYASLLQSYMVHRRCCTSGFQYSNIHQDLQEMANARSESVANDAGYFNIVGNHMLKAAKLAQGDRKPLHLNANKFVASLAEVADVNSRKECLRSLLSAKALKQLMAKTLIKRKRKSKQLGEEHAVIDSNNDSDAVSLDESSAFAQPFEKVAQGEAGQAAYPNRPITREIMENRGLVKYRHKRERNPRVHLRHKFRKATIRYRSRVAPNRRENTPYSGEAKGIRVHLVKSHKFKR